MYSRKGDANKKCEDLARQIVKMDDALAEAAVKIQNLYRKYLDASGALQVVIRIKKTTGDADDPAASALKPMSDGQQVVLATADGSKLFEFDRVLGPDADQKIAYDQVAPFVASALDLHNDALVMAYLLTDALSHGKALVLTNVSPEPEFAAETEKSLLFAQRVRKVELGKARRDVKYKGSETAAGAKRTASRGGRRA